MSFDFIQKENNRFEKAFEKATEEWEANRKKHPVYFGIKQGIVFLFQIDHRSYPEGVLRGVIKLLSIIKQQVVQDSIIKSAKEQKVIQYEDAMPMLIFRETTTFKFAEGDYGGLASDHPLVKFYHGTLDSMDINRKASAEQKAN